MKCKTKFLCSSIKQSYLYMGKTKCNQLLVSSTNWFSDKTLWVCVCVCVFSENIPWFTIPKWHLLIVWQPWKACCCCCCVAPVMSDSVWPNRRQPTKLPCLWDSPGKNTVVGCHFLLQCMKVKSEKWKWSRSSRPHGLQPTRLLCPWDFPGKSTGVLFCTPLYCHCLFPGKHKHL